MTGLSARTNRMRIASLVTAINVLVAGGFSIAGPREPEVDTAGELRSDGSLIHFWRCTPRPDPFPLPLLP